MNFDDELILHTDDELLEDANIMNNLNAQIYGRNIPGSFGCLINKSNVRKYELIILKVQGGNIKLSDLVRALIERFGLNFITSISRKIRFNKANSIFYVYATYDDEIRRFASSISSAFGPRFVLNGRTILVKTLPNFLFGNAQIMYEDANNNERVNNIHFNYLPNFVSSPSSNLLRIITKIEEDEITAANFAGVMLRYNCGTRKLFRYGSFLLNKADGESICLDKLRSVGFDAHRATFSSFIVADRVLRTDRENTIVWNNILSRNNVLTNLSQIDIFNTSPGINHVQRRSTRGNVQRPFINEFQYIAPAVIHEAMRMVRRELYEWNGRRFSGGNRGRNNRNH
ncbi:hypothetical protein PVAND_011315 [Polypedilum vanderplanki]|uniref:Uncharacterized protein n=1 Tax=Polypedilum vanderplanki TaxID=319348 RepID=A0A9J6CJ62_POLVA|nr:hypothetical protein PVAND_011315 [Polypedilum vanderplanki]